MTALELLRTAASYGKSGQPHEALAAVREVMQRTELSPAEIDKAGRIIRQQTHSTEIGSSLLHVLVLGQCTTSWVTTAMVAIGWGQDLGMRVHEGAYDSVIQDLNRPELVEQPPQIVILLPWHQRLFGGAADAADRIHSELEFWRQAWRLIRERCHARVLQVSYDWVVAGPAGHHSATGDEAIAVVRRMNQQLRQELPGGSFFLDLEQLSGLVGRERFYDLRRHYWTKQPFSESGACRLANDLCGGIRALVTGPKKVLVLDLDNTLWGGVVGEKGPLGVSLGDTVEGEAYREFQRYLKGLARRGVLLAVASKNNPDDAREPFEKHPDMVLRLDDLAAIEASWEPKSASIARLAQTLNVGLDSMVFFDDNPAEREQVRQALPMVTVVDVPADPADYIPALERGRWFETTAWTAEDAARTSQYVIERQRRELKTTAASLDEYLESLQMVADVRPLQQEDLARVVQLLAKTNQFNLTTRRHGPDDVLQMQRSTGFVALTLRLRDRFGEHGLVAVLMALPDSSGALRIDTWLMSCRVISRTVEHLLFAYLLDHCTGHRIGSIIGEYIPTKKNAVVATLYEDLGFVRCPDAGDGVIRYRLDVDRAVRPKTFVQFEYQLQRGQAL
jgi:FkbH-like protein